MYRMIFVSSTQEKFKRGFHRLFRRCRRPLGRDRRFSSAGDVSLTGAFHVEDADASSTGGHDRTSSRRRQPRGSDASSVNYYARPRASSTQLTPVAVHRQQSPPASRPTTSGSGTHLTVPGNARYWPVKPGNATDEDLQLAEL